MMPEFFVTGKPLVFCSGNMELELAPHISKMLEGCYVVQTPKELFNILQKLKAGEDPLQDKRKQLISELFGDLSKQASAAITEALAEDANQ